jgi:hypothetical protein
MCGVWYSFWSNITDLDAKTGLAHAQMARLKLSDAHRLPQIPPTSVRAAKTPALRPRQAQVFMFRHI